MNDKFLRRYTDLLLDAIEKSKYPSKELMDRVEAALTSRKQAERYVEILFDKVSNRYPSLELLDRLRRVLISLALFEARSEQESAA